MHRLPGRTRLGSRRPFKSPKIWCGEASIILCSLYRLIGCQLHGCISASQHPGSRNPSCKIAARLRLDGTVEIRCQGMRKTLLFDVDLKSSTVVTRTGQSPAQPPPSRIRIEARNLLPGKSVANPAELRGFEAFTTPSARACW